MSTDFFLKKIMNLLKFTDIKYNFAYTHLHVKARILSVKYFLSCYNFRDFAVGLTIFEMNANNILFPLHYLMYCSQVIEN